MTEQSEHSISEHESRDLSIRGILIFFVALGGMMAIMLVVVTITMTLASGRGPNLQIPPSNLSNAPIPTLPSEPRLEAIPGQQLQKLRANDDKMLHTYGWVDQKAGIVHIPIERAMQMMLQRGLPTRPTGDSKFEDSGDQSPSDSSSGRVQEKYP
jgi:hypothetical protein